MTTASYIFLAVASRGVGREIAKCLSSQNFHLKALLRTEAARGELEAMKIQVVLGDALNLEDVGGMLKEPLHAVISTIGGLPKDSQRADYLGKKNLIDAALKAGAQKFILVSSIGSGNSAVALSPQTLETLRPALDKDKAEQHLIASGLTYTVIRPGGLKSESATKNAILTEDPRFAGMINRADVADLVCRCLNSDSANNKILSAVDQNMLFGSANFEQFKLN